MSSSKLGSVSHFDVLVEIDGALESMVLLDRVQSHLGALSHVRGLGPGGQVLTITENRAFLNTRRL